jgi:polyphenol oxidase
MGLLEAGPHGYVHVWTTDPKNFWGLSNMGMLASAAFDPVFFAHHANIDRLWSKWASMGGHFNPASDRWLKDQPFYFYDQAQVWIGIVPAQTIDTEQSLSYRYQAPQWPPGAAVAKATPAREAGNATRVAEAKPLSAPLVVLNSGAEAKPLPANPTTLQVVIPVETKQRFRALTIGVAPATLVLRIDGVEIAADRSAVVQVFVNRPDVAAPIQGPEPGYVGTIVIVASSPPRRLGLRPVINRNFGLPLSLQMASEISGKDSLSVTLVPVTGDNKPAEVLRYREVYLASR